jgi:hypothetical protein
MLSKRLKMCSLESIGSGRVPANWLESTHERKSPDVRKPSGKKARGQEAEMIMGSKKLKPYYCIDYLHSKDKSTYDELSRRCIAQINMQEGGDRQTYEKLSKVNKVSVEYLQLMDLLDHEGHVPQEVIAVWEHFNHLDKTVKPPKPAVSEKKERSRISLTEEEPAFARKEETTCPNEEISEDGIFTFED